MGGSARRLCLASSPGVGKGGTTASLPRSSAGGSGSPACSTTAPGGKRCFRSEGSVGGSSPPGDASSAVAGEPCGSGLTPCGRPSGEDLQPQPALPLLRFILSSASGLRPTLTRAGVWASGLTAPAANMRSTQGRGRDAPPACASSAAILSSRCAMMYSYVDMPFAMSSTWKQSSSPSSSTGGRLSARRAPCRARKPVRLRPPP
mmetsp:Transcript_45533/g.116508  ORF Transcript_45533/g.116508 Transcript_45533/m.116508 type:complete len:204 (-) Transcript_45533:961-1572(-)